MSVSVGGDGDGGVAEEVLDDFEVGAGGESEGSGAVAEVVEADRREAGFTGEFVEPVCDVGGMERLALTAGEDETPLVPSASVVATDLILTLLVLSKDVGGRVRDSRQWSAGSLISMVASLLSSRIRTAS